MPTFYEDLIVVGNFVLQGNQVIRTNVSDPATDKHAFAIPSGDAEHKGNLLAANSIKVWESTWFSVAALGQYPVSHNLEVIPKGVTVLCGGSATPSEVSVVGPSIAHWHDWGGSDFGAFVRMTSSQVIVRTGHKVGWYSGGWQTSGYYKIIAWA